VDKRVTDDDVERAAAEDDVQLDVFPIDETAMLYPFLKRGFTRILTRLHPSVGKYRKNDRPAITVIGIFPIVPIVSAVPIVPFLTGNCFPIASNREIPYATCSGYVGKTLFVKCLTGMMSRNSEIDSHEIPKREVEISFLPAIHPESIWVKQEK